MRSDRIHIHVLNIGPYQVNTYIVVCPQTLEGVIIDPAGEDDRIKQVIEQNSITPKFILNTHGHRDHTPGNAWLSRHYNLPIGMHTEDKQFFLNRFAFDSPDVRKNYDADLELKHGDIITTGSLNFKTIHTPGHTPGSVCFYAEGHLFSGDTLFVGNAGRTDLPGGDLNTLIHSIKTRLMDLPDETVLNPGHDYGITPTSTIGREKKENIYITDFILFPGG